MRPGQPQLLRGASGALLALALLGSGCQSRPAARSSAPRDGIVQLNLITVPIALNLDGLPGPDGVSAKVYANQAREPKPVRISEGVLEVILFDGSFYGRTNVPPPLRTFRFESSELRAHQFEAGIGTGYEFNLAWGTNRPTERTMSIAARYTDPAGRVVTSRPSSVTVIER
jgi:hypothetical protein